MLSGIGPKKELEEIGIETKIDVPGVGKNLVDHARCACKWASKLKGVNPAHLFSHVEGNLYVRSSINDEGPPDLQIQQDHVRNNEDLLKDPPESSGFNIKPHLVDWTCTAKL